MVFVVVLIPMIMLAALFLFQSGKLTSEKIQLQNAADATAFSLSTIEARDLNFISYVNRAIVANEIGIAQVTGLAAWSDFWWNAPWKWREFDLRYLAGPTLGISSSIVNPIATFVNSIATPVRTAIRSVGRVVVPILTGGNHYILNISAQLFHLSTLFQMGGAVKPLIQGNACPFPDEQGDDCGAKMSDFGLLMMMSHFTTYVDLVGNRVLNPFVRRYSMAATTLPIFEFVDDFYATTTEAFTSQADGFERLAAIIRESRDPFTRGIYAGHPTKSYFPSRLGFRWSPLSLLGELGLPYREPDGLCLELLIIEGCVNFFIKGGRFGGAELRYEEAILGRLPGNIDTAFTVCQRTGACDAQNLATGEEYGWTAAEIATAGWELNFKLRFIWPFESPWTAFTLGQDLNFGTGAASVGDRGDYKNLLGTQLSTPGGFGINAPLNDGYYLYGDAVQSLMTWNDLIQIPYGPAAALDTKETWSWYGQQYILSNYNGLPTYHDVRTSDDADNPYNNEHGFLAPYLVVGLVKGVNPPPAQGGANPSWFVNEPGGMEEPVGDFELIDRENENEGADNELAVIARSEVYFSRPTTVSQWARTTQDRGWPLDVADPEVEEFGSLFSPYWQARLVDTDHATRAAALLVQQGQIYVDENRRVAVSIDVDNAYNLADVILNSEDDPVSFNTGYDNYQDSPQTFFTQRPMPLIGRVTDASMGVDERPFLNPLNPYDQSGTNP